MRTTLETALDQSEFQQMLVDQRFTDRIRKIAKFTIKEGREGGMAVYKRGGRVHYSSPLLPSLKDVKSRFDYQIGMTRWGQEYTSFDPSSLVYNREADTDPDYGSVRYDYDSVRSDLGVLIHSHPNHSTPTGSHIDLWPTPSPHDFLSYERWQRVHPNLIEGVLSVHEGLGQVAMFFYRQSEARGGFQPSYIHALQEEDMPNSALTKKYMQRSGLNAVYAHYSLNPTQLIADPAGVAEELFA